jgi:Zn-dependent protease with chaperone function
MLSPTTLAKEVPMASGNPRSVRVRFRDPIHGKDLTGDALFQQNTVLVVFADGSQVLLPYADGQLTVGGDDGITPILTLVSGYQAYVTLYVEDRRIGDRLDPHMPADLRRRLAKASTGGWWRRLGIVPGLAIVAASVAGVWYGAIWAFDRLIDQVPPSVDVAMGQRMAAAYTADRAPLDPIVSASVMAISQRLTAQLPANQPWAFSFRVLPSKTENAFALPGGPIVITSALIAASDSPDEVAGILGHEIQHVVGRHTFHRIAKELGMTIALALLVGDNTVLATVAYQTKDLVGLSYNRAQESESDRVGMTLANQAGYRADAMASFFRRMQVKAHQRETQEKLTAYLSTHPAHGDRLAQIARLKQALPAPGPKPPALSVDWLTVKRHAAAMSAKATKDVF